MVFIFYHDHEGMSFMTFILCSLYPKDINGTKDEGLLYLTFYVALFLIHSIWEQVPNSTKLSGVHQTVWQRSDPTVDCHRPQRSADMARAPDCLGSGQIQRSTAANPNGRLTWQASDTVRCAHRQKLLLFVQRLETGLGPIIPPQPAILRCGSSSKI
jgi:hypothetical protein